MSDSEVRADLSLELAPDGRPRGLDGGGIVGFCLGMEVAVCEGQSAGGCSRSRLDRLGGWYARRVGALENGNDGDECRKK